MPNAPLANEPLPEEIEDQQIVDLPAREALAIVDPGIFGLRTPTLLGRTADQPPAAEPAAPEGDPQT